MTRHCAAGAKRAAYDGRAHFTDVESGPDARARPPFTASDPRHALRAGAHAAVIALHDPRDERTRRGRERRPRQRRRRRGIDRRWPQGQDGRRRRFRALRRGDHGAKLALLLVEGGALRGDGEQAGLGMAEAYQKDESPARSTELPRVIALRLAIAPDAGAVPPKRLRRRRSRSGNVAGPGSARQLPANLPHQA
jgi:hypothetical protein